MHRFRWMSTAFKLQTFILLFTSQWSSKCCESKLLEKGVGFLSQQNINVKIKFQPIFFSLRHHYCKLVKSGRLCIHSWHKMNDLWLKTTLTKGEKIQVLCYVGLVLSRMIVTPLITNYFWTQYHYCMSTGLCRGGSRILKWWGGGGGGGGEKGAHCITSTKREVLMAGVQEALGFCRSMLSC